MFELSLEREFCAAHAITMKGDIEPRHGHNWRIVVTVGGEKLDDDGLLCDFHLVEQSLDRVLGRFHNADLNETPPFNEVNPTAENVVKHVAESIVALLPAGVRVVRVSVSEAPGCTATYSPDS